MRTRRAFVLFLFVLGISAAPGAVAKLPLRLEIAFMPAVSEEPNFALKETYLLFLKRTPSGAEVVVGYLGALMIKDGFVKTGEINDEPELQSVDTFVERIGIAMQVPTTH